VVDPQYLVSFLGLGGEQMDALLTSVMRSGDWHNRSLGSARNGTRTARNGRSDLPLSVSSQVGSALRRVQVPLRHCPQITFDLVERSANRRHFCAYLAH
jgi:hypothetical protein